MKKQNSLQAFALAETQLLAVKGGAYKVTFERPDGSHGFIIIDVIDGARVGQPLSGTSDIVVDIAAM